MHLELWHGRSGRGLSRAGRPCHNPVPKVIELSGETGLPCVQRGHYLAFLCGRLHTTGRGWPPLRQIE